MKSVPTPTPKTLTDFDEYRRAMDAARVAASELESVDARIRELQNAMADPETFMDREDAIAEVKALNKKRRGLREVHAKKCQELDRVRCECSYRLCLGLKDEHAKLVTDVVRSTVLLGRAAKKFVDFNQALVAAGIQANDVLRFPMALGGCNPLAITNYGLKPFLEESIRQGFITADEVAGLL